MGNSQKNPFVILLPVEWYGDRVNMQAFAKLTLAQLHQDSEARSLQVDFVCPELFPDIETMDWPETTSVNYFSLGKRVAACKFCC